MTNEERAGVNEKALRSLANQIEDIRIELYSWNIIDDEDDKVYVDDKLFCLQSQLRDIADLVECYS